MQNRPEVTAMLSLSIQRHICPNSDPRIYWAREVTFDYATTNVVRVDFMKFKPVNNTVSGIEKGDFYCGRGFSLEERSQLPGRLQLLCDAEGSVRADQERNSIPGRRVCSGWNELPGRVVRPQSNQEGKEEGQK